MRIALIGGAGYIGTNLRMFLEKENEVVLSYDKAAGHHAENIYFFSNFDCVVHLAAFPGVVNCENDLELATIDNISSAFNVFRICFNQKIPCIFISSQAAKHPDHSRYGTIKRMIEIEADRYNDRKADIRVLRFTNVYGGHGYTQMKKTVIANIIKSIREEKEFIINGQGVQKRDFIHINDICKAIYLTIKTEPFRQPLDIGTGVGTSVLDLVKMFQSKTKGKLLFTNNMASDMIGPMSSIADISPAKVILGFHYNVKLNNWIQLI